MSVQLVYSHALYLYLYIFLDGLLFISSWFHFKCIDQRVSVYFSSSQTTVSDININAGLSSSETGFAIQIFKSVYLCQRINSYIAYIQIIYASLLDDICIV